MVRYRRQTTPPTLPPAAAVRIVLFGLDCVFTSVFTRSLLDAGVAISAIILPGLPSIPRPIRANAQRRPITLGTPEAEQTGMLSIADHHEISTWRVGNLQSEGSLEMLAGVQAELLVCACFNRKIPGRLYESLPLGGVNVHPSLLPDKRGPDPQFWTFKQGTGETGITIHRLSAQFDSGPILAHEALSYPDGIAERALDRLCAAAGARLLGGILPRLRAGTLPETEQDHARATYAPFPSTDDFHLDLNRPARTAYNFINGIRDRGVPIMLDWNGQQHQVLDALEYADKPRSLDEDDPANQWVPFTPGATLLRLSTSDP